MQSHNGEETLIIRINAMMATGASIDEIRVFPEKRVQQKRNRLKELFLTKNQEKIMKIYALLVVLMVALGGCSSSLKGSVGSVGNHDAAKSGNYVASNTVTNHFDTVAGK